MTFYANFLHTTPHDGLPPPKRFGTAGSHLRTTHLPPSTFALPSIARSPRH
jgi:hypothetical protein